jgi:xanthine dehydrogenase YagR molybdenum-binding subunit
VVTHENAPKLASTGDADVAVLHSDEVAFRGQFMGAGIAETPEIARDAASLVRVDYEERAHGVELPPDCDDLHKQ